MKFIEFYLKNKKKFPELEFFEVKYSGDNNGYNSQGEMKYLERDMIIMIPKACSQLLKENLKSINKLRTYIYFENILFQETTDVEIKKYESLFLTPDNKILIPISEFVYDYRYEADPYAFNETRTLLNEINSFLKMNGLDLKYCSILSSEPEMSFTWSITKNNFTSIKKYDLKVNYYKAFKSSKNSFKKIVLKK